VIGPVNCLLRFVGVSAEGDPARGRLAWSGVNSRSTKLSVGESGGVSTSIESKGGGENGMI